jgi:NADH dehydrogenase
LGKISQAVWWSVKMQRQLVEKREKALRQRVVIVGGGFGGLYTAQRLGRADVDVTLVDRRNFHLFQPLLYQVATGGLSPADIASPLRSVLNRQRNTRVIQGEVVDFDLTQRRVLLSDGELPYDTLVVAAGAASHYFGKPEWEAVAPSLKTVEDAIEVRRRVLEAFEHAERESDPELRRAWLTFVVVGAGPTGVELAGALGELARHTLAHDFRAFDPADARVILLEGAERVLPPYPEPLSGKAVQSLQQLGVEVRTGVRVTEIGEGRVTLAGTGGGETLPTRTVLWAAGMRASALGELLARQAEASTDPSGRVMVQPDLTLPGFPEVYVIGDLAYLEDKDGKPLAGVAPVAIQQGRFVAERIRCRGRSRPERFHYRDKGSLAVIGRHAAVAAYGKLHLSGFCAWLAWMFIHLLYLVEFDNQVIVLFQWAWSYFTRRRGARLITAGAIADDGTGRSGRYGLAG